MARTWLSVTVELLSGHGTELWPYPGRVFAVGPSHTFMDFAHAINDAFARWDRSHLSMFELSDGSMITDAETGAELAGGVEGPIAASLDIESTKVAGTVEPGQEFRFTFDLGDQWVHRCHVATGKVDPLEVLGISPRRPSPYFGWGSIPDQYGRRWAEDDGESPLPQRPTQPHPMVLGTWPDQKPIQPPDATTLRMAIAEGDALGFLSAVVGRDIDDALQQVGSGVPMALEQIRDQAEPVALAVINRLRWRDGVGDDVLAEDLLAHLRRERLKWRTLPVDLEDLGSVLEGDMDQNEGRFVDLRTGEVYNSFMTDAAMIGEDAAIDVDEDPDRWLWFRCEGSQAAWQDMADFAERQQDTALRDRLQRAIAGRGAFRRFRDEIAEENLTEQWYVFANDRQIGRARQFLADEGIRVGKS